MNVVAVGGGVGAGAPESPDGSAPQEARPPLTTPGPPAWEVFVRSRRGLAHRHAGTVRAADPAEALVRARAAFVPPDHGVSVWLVPTASLHASLPEQRPRLFEPAHDKDYRHPTFYELPPEVQHL